MKCCELLSLLAVTVLASACERGAPVCRFGREHRLFQSSSQVLHDLRTEQLGTGMLALFSDASGVHALPLDSSGAPRGPARRLFEACDGGLDADSGKAELHVVCLRRAAPDGTAVTLYALDTAFGVRELARFGNAGRLSKGISLSRAGPRLAVAWHAAAVSGGSIWYWEPPQTAGARTEPPPSSTGAEPRQLSDAGWEPSAPSLTWDGERLYATWAETRFAGERAESRILVARPDRREAPHVVLASRDPAPSPHLAPAPGGLILSFRDKRESLRKTGLYLARLDLGGRLAGQVLRVGRADGVASPVLEPCLGGVVSATPRTFAGDYFVGVMRADTELSRLSREQQFYEDSREYDRVAVHCGPAGAVLLIGERGRLLRGNAALSSTTFVCD